MYSCCILLSQGYNRVTPNLIEMLFKEGGSVFRCFKSIYKFVQTRCGNISDQGRDKYRIIVAGKYEMTYEHIRCFKYNNNGHFENQCSNQQDINSTGTNYTQEFVFVQNNHYVKLNWISIDFFQYHRQKQSGHDYQH